MDAATPGRSHRTLDSLDPPGLARRREARSSGASAPHCSDRERRQHLLMGPITIYDKSALQALSMDESVWLDVFFLVNAE